MKKKNIVIIVATLAVIAAAFVGCGDSNDSGFVKGARETENWAKGVGKAVSGK